MNALTCIASLSKRLLLAYLLFSSLSACNTVAFYDKERLNDPIMQFDRDSLSSEIRQHILNPREGAIGGFGPIGAGGCSCK